MQAQWTTTDEAAHQAAQAQADAVALALNAEAEKQAAKARKKALKDLADRTRADRIRAARQAKGLTQEQVAERLGKMLGRNVLQLEISRWETGARVPQSASVAMLRKVLGPLF